MLRATIGLLALTLITQAQAGEITLSCDGVASHFFRPGTKPVTGMSLIVDLADRSVVWDRSRLPVDGYDGFGVWVSDEHTLYFGNAGPGRTFTTERDSYFITGSIDRVTGRTKISEHVIHSRSNDPGPETQYDLLCKPVKPLF
jgi:hypothetical protein